MHINRVDGYKRFCFNRWIERDINQNLQFRNNTNLEKYLNWCRILTAWKVLCFLHIFRQLTLPMDNLQLSLLPGALFFKEKKKVTHTPTYILYKPKTIILGKLRCSSQIQKPAVNWLTHQDSTNTIFWSIQ